VGHFPSAQPLSHPDKNCITFSALKDLKKLLRRAGANPFWWVRERRMEKTLIDILRYYLNLIALKSGKGQGLVEYALIVVLISIVSIVIMTTLGGSITSTFSRANTSLVSP
jgi:Flp pilus assembly pilin Flp